MKTTTDRQLKSGYEILIAAIRCNVTLNRDANSDKAYAFFKR